MEYFFYLIILSIILLVFFLFKNKSLIITIISSLLIIQIIVAPKLCIDSAVSGALLFFYKVFPSLFPFLVISNIILAYDGVYIYSKIFGKLLCKPLGLPVECSFVLIISMLCGYPLGAKYSCDLYERKIIDKVTCERLVNIASNPSPLFILGSVGTSMLNSTLIGYILLFSCYASCIIIGLLLPNKNRTKKGSASAKHDFVAINIGSALKNSVENALNTSLSIGGFVIIFSVVITFVKNRLFINSEIIENSFIGLIEMTNGCNLVSSTNCGLYIKIIIISFILSFSGLSIIAQVYSFTYKHNVSMIKYTAIKAIQGIICSFISITIYNIFLSSSSVFVSNIYIQMFSFSESIYFALILMFILPFILYKLFSLFKFS